ncbi:MAG: serine hydrolase [Pseudomonadota bacterium]
MSSPASHPVLRSRRLAALALVLLSCNSCLAARIVYFNTPTLAVANHFDNRAVRASSSPLPIVSAAREATFTLSAAEQARYGSLEALLEAQDTRAFVVIHDDQVVYERYFHGISAHSALPGFSMSKTFTAALVGRAVSQGLLPSLAQSVADAIPELAQKQGYGAITLEELLRMTSGIDFDEESLAGAKLYYTTDLRDLIYSYDVKWPAGQHYLYGSVNIELLWDAIHRRLGGETVSSYFERQLWAPLGAERGAFWSLDSQQHGVEKAFAGFNATARDQARLGLLFLHGGTLNGREILPRSWVARALSDDPVAGWVHTTDGWVRRAKYQWFITANGRGYFAKGYHGQYIFVVPERRAVFVRFGEGYGELNWPALFLRLADSFR